MMGAVHQTVLLYSKGQNTRWNPQFMPYDDWYVERYYRYKGPDGRRFMSADYTGEGSGPPRRFGERGEVAPPPGRHWMHDQAGVDRMLTDDRIFFTRNDVPRLKVYLDEAPGQALHDVWTDILPIVSWSSEREDYPVKSPDVGFYSIETAISPAETDAQSEARSTRTSCCCARLPTRWSS